MEYLIKQKPIGEIKNSIFTLIEKGRKKLEACKPEDLECLDDLGMKSSQ